MIIAASSRIMRWMRLTTALLLAGLVLPAAIASCVTEERTDDDGRFSTDAASSSSSGVGIGGAGGNPVGPGAGGNSTSSSSTSGSGAGVPCPDNGPEPNNSEATATNLGMIDDCDNSGSMVSGTLAGNDVDWYKYQGSDTFGCNVDAYRSITSDGQARVCKFPDCPNLVVTCPAGTVPETSPTGLAGCCSLNPFQLAVDCPNTTSDDATVYIRVDKPPSFACVNYTLEFHY
jgi:hypothetical protein